MTPKPSTQRIRGRRLQQIRHAHFSAHPLCVLCDAQGRVSAATELDHTLALVNGGTDTDDNRQGLCQACHAGKTSRDLGHVERAAFDASGRVVW